MAGCIVFLFLFLFVCAAPSPAAIGFRRLAEPDPYDGNAAGFDAVLYTVEAEC